MQNFNFLNFFLMNDSQSKVDEAVLPDWSQQVPQALVFNTQPGVVDSPKFGVWHLPSSMVRLIFFISANSLLTSL